MGKTRSMIRKIKHDEASKMNRIKTCENRGVALWSDLNHDVLLLVMMQLGVIDFLAFGGVCKSWRSLALCNRNRFMVSRTPMSISISTDDNEEECCLEDFEARKFKTTLPRSADKSCIGVTCGYLILMGVETDDFWLVNPITMHEFHFPSPDGRYSFPASLRGILVFSPSISGWVFVALSRYYPKIWFCIAGKREWTHFSTSLYILDVVAFKGKIYTLHSDIDLGTSSVVTRLSEVRLYPTPKVTLLEIKNSLKPYFRHPVFVSSSENLYVMDRFSKHPLKKIQEINFSKMELVSYEKIDDKHAIFLGDLNYSAAVMLESLADLHSQYRRYALTHESGKGRLYYATLWYLFHDCLNVNLLHE